MHQVHAEAQLSKRRNDSGCRLLNSGEHEEEAKSGDQHVQRAELPTPFQHRRLNRNSRLALPPEAPCRKSCADEEANQADANALLAVPCEMEADVMRQDKIAEVAGAIPKHVEAVPEAFAPQLFADKTVQPGHDCRKSPEYGGSYAGF